MEVNDMIEALYISDEKGRRYEAERRKKFFEAIGEPDDGRWTPELTKEECESFSKGKRVVEEKSIQKTPHQEVVPVYSYFAPYHDVSIGYIKSMNLLVESRFYIGD